MKCKGLLFGSSIATKAMSLFPTLSSGQTASSPLSFEGHGGIRVKQREEHLRLLGRREWWLWFSALAVTVLSASVLLLSSFRKFFLYRDHFYEITSAQARWGILCLLLLFNAWMAYRQWSFRRMRARIAGEDAPGEEPPSVNGLETSSALDSVSGLPNRTALELQLGKEISRARRQNTSLTLITLHFDDFDQLVARVGKGAADELAGEFARRLKDASRGSDFAARIAADEFLLLLPKCSLKEARVVLERLGTVEIKAAGQKISLPYTSGWVDYQPGDMPSDLLRRATDILHLYKSVASDVTLVS